MNFTLFDIISIAAVVSYFIPMIIVLLKKLWKDPFFMFFASYWTLGGLVNLCDVVPGFTRDSCYIIGVLYNIFDIPIILAILYITSNSRAVRNVVPFFAVIVICLELIGLARLGFTFDALKYPLGAGIVMVLVIVTMEIVKFMQTIEHSNRQNAMMFVYAAILFEYATFIVIYIFDYFVESENRQDSFIIYYVSTLGAILIASCGYLLFKRYDRNSNFIRV